jgi:hypothetical protein
MWATEHKRYVTTAAQESGRGGGLIPFDAAWVAPAAVSGMTNDSRLCCVPHRDGISPPLDWRPFHSCLHRHDPVRKGRAARSVPMQSRKTVASRRLRMHAKWIVMSVAPTCISSTPSADHSGEDAAVRDAVCRRRDQFDSVFAFFPVI